MAIIESGNGLKKHERLKVLFLTLGPGLRGPLPKLAPPFITSLANLGVRITRIDWGRHSEQENLFQKLIGRLGDTSSVLLQLARWRPDVLYVATTLDEYALARDVPLLLVASLSPAKKVLMMHGSNTRPLQEPGNRIYKLLTLVLIRLSDAILLLSTDEVGKWTRFCARTHYFLVDNPFLITTPPKGASVATNLGKQSFPTLLFVGRLIREKGVFELIDAMRRVLKNAQCRLVMVGDGQERAALISRIQAAGLDQSISLLGYLDSDRLAELYRSASVFILPSYREGFPSSITEAMSFHLPIVSTPVGGIPDHLKDGINALFVPIGDPEAIADAIIHLLVNPELREKMGQSNLVKVQDFAPERVAPKYLAIFRELMARNLVNDDAGID